MPAKKQKKQQQKPKEIISQTIEPFSRKMNYTALGVLLGGLVVGSGVLAVAPPTAAGAPNPALYIFQVVMWLYLGAILMRFHRQTGLTEYVLRYHLFWLTGVVSFPLAFIVSLVTDLVGLPGWIAAAGGLLWPLAFFVARYVVLKDHWFAFLGEVMSQEGRFKRLAGLKVMDILLMRFAKEI